MVHDVPSTAMVFVLAENRDAFTFAVHVFTTSSTLVMFTDADIQASNKFADTNTKIRTIRLLYRKAPHLASKLKYTVRDALPQDYYIPESIRHACKVIDVDLTEDLCRALSCNPTTENGMCKSNMTASYYYVGDDSYDVQCQPACFNTVAKQTYSQDGSRVPDTPMLNYHSGKCRIVPSTVVSYLEKTFFRSDTVYENRKNDMPTGFSRTPSDDPYGCGFDYKTNATYCKYYDRTLQEDGSCGLEWWEVGLDAVVGMSLINTVKSSVRMLSNDRKPFALPTNLPELPATLESKYTVDGWKQDVNRSFVVPELIDTKPKSGGGGGGGGTNAAPHESARLQYEEEQQSRIERMKTAMLGMLEQAFTDRSFWIHLGVGVVSEAVLDNLKSLCKKIIEKLSLSLVKRVPQMVTDVGVNVLKAGLKSTCTKIVTDAVIRIASKTAIAVAKITAAAVSVVGWLLIAATLLDIMFSFWDPYGYNNMFPPTLPHDLMANGERAFRQAAESATVDYEFDNFVALILSEEEMLSVQVESLQDRLVYLDSLVVNSDGTRIDKGETINLNGERVSLVIDAAHKQTMVQRVRFDPESYAEYNRDFLTRVRINEYVNYGALACMTVAGVCTFAGLYLLGVLFTLLTLVAFAVARLQLNDNTILDFIKFRSATSAGR